MLASLNDIEFADNICKHLLLLKKSDLINALWHNGMIEPGRDAIQITTENILSSNLVILLVSVDFFSDEFLAMMLEKIERIYIKGGEIEVYPILCRYCDWRNHKFLTRFRILPHTDKPIVSKDWHSQDEVYLVIKNALEFNINRIREKGIQPTDRAKSFKSFLDLSTKNKLVFILRQASTLTFKVAIILWAFFILAVVFDVLSIHWALLITIILSCFVYNVIKMKDVFIEKWNALTSSSIFVSITAFAKIYIWEKIKEFIFRR